MPDTRDTGQPGFCTRASRFDLLQELAAASAAPAPAEPARAPAAAKAPGWLRYVRWTSRST